MALGIGLFLIAISVTKEIQSFLRSINRKAGAKNDQSKELKAMFLEFMDAHTAIKQLSIILKKRNAFKHSTAAILYFKIKLPLSD